MARGYLTTTLEILATVCAGLFAGAALYINLVEHPARRDCGTVLAVRQFAPSYRRAAVMQASLAIVGLASAGLRTVLGLLAFGTLMASIALATPS